MQEGGGEHEAGRPGVASGLQVRVSAGVAGTRLGGGRTSGEYPGVVDRDATAGRVEPLLERGRAYVKRNTIAVVTDGSAVLGLGNIGPAAALPVMEGKAALFKKFGEVNAWPVCLDTQDTEEIIRTVELIAPVYAGINLEDIAAPRCFEIERRLRDKLDIPVFHDDQHGTAIVVVGALRNALRVVDKDISQCKIVVCGAGAAGSAIIRLLLHKKPGDILAVDIDGIVHGGRENLDPNLRWLAEHTNADHVQGRSRTRWSAPTCSSASRPRTCSARTRSPR